MKKQADAKSDLRDTATIGAIGAGTSVLTHKILGGAEHGKAALVGGALGLAGDYAAVRLNKHLAKPPMTKTASNKYLEKIAGLAWQGYTGDPVKMEKEVAKQHGKTVENKGFFGNIKHRMNLHEESNKGTTVPALKGLAVGGAAVGGAAAGLAHLVNKHPAVRRKMDVAKTGVTWATGGGLVVGNYLGSKKRGENLVTMKKEMNKKYSQKDEN